MAQVMICSKFMNDVKMRIYETKNHASDELKKNGVAVDSRVAKELVIHGRNTAKREKGILMPYSLTLVDKDTWDAIYASCKNTDPLLINNQIFQAKNENEAEVISKDNKGNFCDFLTASEIKEKAEKRKKMQRAMI